MRSEAKRNKIRNLLTPILAFLLVINIAYSCEESWQCGYWSKCMNNTQTRGCIDLNSCGTLLKKPNTTITCGIPTTYIYDPNELGENYTNNTINLSRPVCGNGRIEAGETYLNCNNDVRPTIDDFFNCIIAGKEKCNYYERYTNILMAGFLIILTLALVQSKKYFQDDTKTTSFK